VPGLEELARRHTELSAADLARLRVLLADWQLLADLSFSDLVLWLPTWNGSGYVAGAQLRPTTGPTVFAEDLVGSFLPRGRRPAVDEALTQARVITSTVDPDVGQPVRTVPVPGPGVRKVIAVVAQHSDARGGDERSRLEGTYLEVAGRLFDMVAAGEFPFPGDAHDPEDSPRVGDGLLLLDAQGLVAYASPNALSAYRRLGLAADLVGSPLAQTSRFLSPPRTPLDVEPTGVLTGRVAGSTEVEARGAVVALRSIPLGHRGTRSGAVVLLRDVSDLRRRERELVTKDATIREIHHRVKNNLQTVAALLRLQARRLHEVPEAVAALTEAEQRVASIALVHETLSTSPDPDVPFDEVADRLVAMVADLAGGPAAVRASTRRVGSFGELDADLATPLALVLTELVHNALEHGLAGNQGDVLLRAERSDEALLVAVEDDGRGLPDGFDGGAGAGLGLQIARTLVADLGGQIELGPRVGGGTCAVVRLPLRGWVNASG
jgi:two-component sensor histidine kinase